MFFFRLPCSQGSLFFVMFTFHRIIDSSNPLFVPAMDIYINSFPDDERRRIEDVEKLLSKDFYHFIAVYDERGRVIAILVYWQFTSFYYVEYLAVSPKYKAHGFGSQIMKKFLEKRHLNLPVILEVEKIDEDVPEYELLIRKRRVKFYLNLGFTLSDVPYIQPPYAPGLKEVPLALMQFGDILTNNALEVINTLHNRVYLTPFEK